MLESRSVSVAMLVVVVNGLYCQCGRGGAEEGGRQVRRWWYRQRDAGRVSWCGNGLQLSPAAYSA